MRQAFRRIPVQAPVRQKHETATFPAPTRGWVTNESLAAPGKAAALILENWFPMATSARFRGGSRKHATLDAEPVTGIFGYVSGATKKLFAANDAAIYDISPPISPTALPTAAVLFQTSGDYSTTQFGTAGGDFLYACNGDDDPQMYNGTLWQAMNATSVPTLTGASNLSFVWQYRSRLYFIQRDSLSVWYLDTNSVGGALTELPLAGLFGRGGSLLCGATWSIDGGDGMDDKWVVFTTEGEVAVYQGGNPGDSADWALQGRYDITKPMGKNCTLQVGGDVLVLTVEGIIPLSQVIGKDVAALSLSAVSRPIEPDWKREVALRGDLPWRMVKWPSRNLGLVTLPTWRGSEYHYCFVVNLQTGAWAKYTGWDTRCAVVHDDKLYFGTSGGLVMRGERGGLDNGSPIDGTYVGQFDHLRSPAVHKTILDARAVMKYLTPTNPLATVSTDYRIVRGSGGSEPDGSPEMSLWGVGLWGEALWGAGVAEWRTRQRWQSVGRSGFAVAPQVHIRSTKSYMPRVEFVSFDVTFEKGNVVV